MIQLFPADLLKSRRIFERLQKDFYVSDDYFKGPDHKLQASDLWWRLTSSGEGLEALVWEVQAVVGTDFTAVVVNGFDNLLAAVQLLSCYAHEPLFIGGIFCHMLLTYAECLHIARKSRQYCSFDIGMKDIVIAAIDLQYLHFVGLRDAGPRAAFDDAEWIKRYLGEIRWPINHDG